MNRPALALAVLLLSVTFAHAQDKPNIILIMVDDK